MEVEEIPPHAHRLDRGATAAVGADGDGGGRAVGVDGQAAVFRRVQGLLHQLRLQRLAEGIDILQLLALVHRQIAGQLGKAGLALPAEPPGGGEGLQGMAHTPHAKQGRCHRQQQHNIPYQQKPLLEAEASQCGGNPPEGIGPVHHGFSTIRTRVPASRGLLEVVIT